MFKTLSGKRIAIDNKKLELITLIKEGKKGLKEKRYLVYRTPLVNSAQNTPFPCIKESKKGFKQYLLFEPKLSPTTTKSPFNAKKLDFHSRAADHKLALKCIRVVSSVVSGLNPDEGQFPSGYGLKVEYDSRFLTPYAEGGDVLCFLNSNRRNLTLGVRSSLGLKILKKFAALHRIGIIHRDIKPENILMRRGEPFICDFGFSEKEGVSLKSCGSRKFIPPEYRPKAFLGKSLRLKNAPEDSEPFSVKQIDLYTLGSTLFTVLADRFLDDALELHLRNYVPPFYPDEWDGKEFSVFQDFQKEFVHDAIIHFLEPYPQSIIEVIQGLTALSPKERMPLKTAIEKWEQCEQSD
jgi:serine/threonine protein kinase